MSVLEQEISLSSIRELLTKKKKTKKKETALKTTINFVADQEKETNWFLAIPGIILIVAAAAVFAKFGVIDRYARLAKAEAEVSAIQKRYDEAVAYLNGSEELSEEFYHYTWTLHSDVELNRIQRTEIADLVRTIGDYGVTVRSYSLTDVNMNLDLHAENLQSLSLLAENLRKNKIVSTCTVNTARTQAEVKETANGVDAQMTLRVRTRAELQQIEEMEGETANE